MSRSHLNLAEASLLFQLDQDRLNLTFNLLTYFFYNNYKDRSKLAGKYFKVASVVYKQENGQLGED